MIHEIAPKRRAVDARRQQQPRRADAIAGDDDGRRRLQIFGAMPISIGDARGATRFDMDMTAQWRWCGVRRRALWPWANR